MLRSSSNYLKVCWLLSAHLMITQHGNRVFPTAFMCGCHWLTDFFCNCWTRSVRQNVQIINHSAFVWQISSFKILFRKWLRSLEAGKKTVSSLLEESFFPHINGCVLDSCSTFLPYQSRRWNHSTALDKANASIHCHGSCDSPPTALLVQIHSHINQCNCSTLQVLI